jgi:hypothetical protein
MCYIALMPKLRKLRAQGTVATDEGFIALSRSASLEKLLGARVPESHRPRIRRAVCNAGPAPARREL